MPAGYAFHVLTCVCEWCTCVGVIVWFSRKLYFVYFLWLLAGKAEYLYKIAVQLPVFILHWHSNLTRHKPGLDTEVKILIWIQITCEYKKKKEKNIIKKNRLKTVNLVKLIVKQLQWNPSFAVSWRDSFD